MHASVTRESICKANALFWDQMVALRLKTIDSHGSIGSIGALGAINPPEPRCIGEEHVVGSCELSGGWAGLIEIRLSRSMALAATAAMLMQPVETVVASDTLDAAKEIANMIAGTLKSALPRPCAMTVPTAAVEPANFCILPRTEDSVTVFFEHAAEHPTECPPGELMIRVLEYAPDLEQSMRAFAGGRPRLPVAVASPEVI